MCAVATAVTQDWLEAIFVQQLHIYSPAIMLQMKTTFVYPNFPQSFFFLIAKIKQFWGYSGYRKYSDPPLDFLLFVPLQLFAKIKSKFILFLMKVHSAFHLEDKNRNVAIFANLLKKKYHMVISIRPFVTLTREKMLENVLEVQAG